MAAIAPVLILGVGNILLRDEGLGVRAIEALLGGPDIGEDIEIIDGGTGGATLVDLVADRRKVVVIDAIDAGQPPGTMLRVPLEQLAAASRPSVSLHEMGLLEAVAITRTLGCEPREIVVIGVQPALIEPGLDLSAPVAAVLEDLAVRALDEARRP